MNPVILPSAITYRGETNKAFVEVEVSSGIGIHLVGLADSDVKETLLRVVTALQSCGYHIPGKKLVINIKGADLKTRKLLPGWLDFPIAIGILLASGQIKAGKGEIQKTIFVGEVGLDGSLRAPGNNGGFVNATDAALVLSWRYRDDFSIWGWDTDCKGGNTWLDVKDLADAVELLQSSYDDEKKKEVVAQ